MNGTCGPYRSLLTNSQSPISSAGIMDPDGMRYASMKNARMNRKIASVPAIDLKFSHARRENGLEPRPPLRAAATTLLGFSAFFLATDLVLGKLGEAR